VGLVWGEGKKWGGVGIGGVGGLDWVRWRPRLLRNQAAPEARWSGAGGLACALKVSATAFARGGGGGGAGSPQWTRRRPTCRQVEHLARLQLDLPVAAQAGEQREAPPELALWQRQVHEAEAGGRLAWPLCCRAWRPPARLPPPGGLVQQVKVVGERVQGPALDEVADDAQQPGLGLVQPLPRLLREGGAGRGGVWGVGGGGGIGARPSAGISAAAAAAAAVAPPPTCSVRRRPPTATSCPAATASSCCSQRRTAASAAVRMRHAATSAAAEPSASTSPCPSYTMRPLGCTLRSRPCVYMPRACCGGHSLKRLRPLSRM
jgi:hypothetical protein